MRLPMFAPRYRITIELGAFSIPGDTPMLAVNSSPVLYLQSAHPRELAYVRIDHHQSPCQRGSGDQNIVSAYWLSAGFERSADCRRGFGIGCIERQRGDGRKESIQHWRQLSCPRSVDREAVINLHACQC